MERKYQLPTNRHPNGQTVTCVIHSTREGDADDDASYDPRTAAARYNNALLIARMGGLPAGVVLCHDAIAEYTQLLEPKQAQGHL